MMSCMNQLVDRMSDDDEKISQAQIQMAIELHLNSTLLHFAGHFCHITK